MVALPTRGQPDWDDEIANAFAELDAGVQSATANASAALSDAAYAKNRADEVHTSVLGGADAATAGFIDDPASATRASFSATVATETDALDLDRSGVVYLDSYPRQGAESDDAPRLGRALAAAATLGAKVLQLGATTYILTTSTIVSGSNLTIRGAGKQATTLQVTTDVVGLDITGNYVSLEHLKVDTTTVARTVFPVVFNDAKHGALDHVYFNGAVGARFSGAYYRAITTNASMGFVDHCVFNHSCLRVETWDVQIRHCYIWAMTCDYGIGVYNGAGNGFLDQVSIVPPLKTTATGLAGLHFDSASGAAGTWDGSVYIDGNTTLSVRQGISINNGWYNIDLTVKSNKMDSPSVVIDSAYNIAIDYHGESNNEGGDGSPDIVVRQTGAQPVEKIRLTGQCLRKTAVTGTAGPAVKVESTVTQANQVFIDVDVKQPTGGGGFTLPEIDVPLSGGYPTQRLGNSRGQLSVYRAVGSQAVASGATSTTINLGSPYPMAYRPRLSQITLGWESAGATMPAHRITYSSDNQIFIAFAAATTNTATIHWRAHLD